MTKKEYQRKYYLAHQKQIRKYQQEWTREKRGVKYPERLIDTNYKEVPKLKPEKEVPKLRPEIACHQVFKEEPKVCPICRAKERDKRWLLTNYCSLRCYSLWLKNKKNNKDSGQWYRNIFVET